MARRTFGSVRQLPSGRWQVRYRGSDGTLRPAQQTYRTKAEAGRALAEIETELAAGEWQDPRRAQLTLGEYAETWLATRRVRGRPLAIHLRDAVGDGAPGLHRVHVQVPHQLQPGARAGGRGLRGGFIRERDHKERG